MYLPICKVVADTPFNTQGGPVLLRKAKRFLFCTRSTACTTSRELNIIPILKLEVSDFEVLLIDFTFYLYHVRKLVFIVLVKIMKK